MATKARTPKSTQATATAAAAVPAAGAAALPATPAPAPAAGPQAQALYALTAKQPRNGNTLQGAKSGLGKAWYTAAKPGTNTRALAYAALAALPSPFTQAAGLAALAPVVAGTSGTARSYWAAFVASGYIAQA